ncbi:MAG: ATP-binding protein [Acidobacteriota bacterium]
MAENESPGEDLRFIFSPHILEDLGLNLYTTVARGLVEFVANSYDADGSYARITFSEGISDARRTIKCQFDDEKEAHQEGEGPEPSPLESRALPDDLTIEILDDGHGMSRAALRDKFLVAARRRRKEEPEAQGRSPGGRPLMGRKGLGKLAGFGVARVLEVTSKADGEEHATCVTLDYNKLVDASTEKSPSVAVKTTTIPDGAGLGEHGTRVVLRQLLYGPTKSRPKTVKNEIAEAFDLISPKDFKIDLNGDMVEPPTHAFSFAWPEPERAPEELVESTFLTEYGVKKTFSYRLRFREQRASLPARMRGIRIYVRNRMAAPPSLLEADTNMHGFRMTDYLDGVVHADFLDEEDEDYIATDRQGLRWETSLLGNLWTDLSKEIKTACSKRQKQRDDEGEKRVKEDGFTQQLIKSPGLSSNDRKMALRLARVLERGCKNGVDDDVYKAQLPQLVAALGTGTVMQVLAKLGEQELPDFGATAAQIARLTASENDRFVSFARSRLQGIELLRRIVKSADFTQSKCEKEVQKLFEKNPWLVLPAYGQLLSADRNVTTMHAELAKALGIGEFAPATVDKKKRPDLVFLLSNMGLGKLFIVELKAPELPLEHDHLGQLQLYMEDAKVWLRENDYNLTVHGELIGTMPRSDARGVGARLLRKAMDDAGPDTPWRVRSFVRVLKDATIAHEEFLAIQDELDDEQPSSEEDD